MRVGHKLFHLINKEISYSIYLFTANSVRPRQTTKYDYVIFLDNQHSTPTTEDDAKHSGVKYTAAVALTSGIQTKPGTHLSSQIKFLVAKQDRSDLMLIGGPWSKSADGGDPADSDGALIKTAT